LEGVCNEFHDLLRVVVDLAHSILRCFLKMISKKIGDRSGKRKADDLRVYNSLVGCCGPSAKRKNETAALASSPLSLSSSDFIYDVIIMGGVHIIKYIGVKRGVDRPIIRGS
jgi:hypothetical protein